MKPALSQEVMEDQQGASFPPAASKVLLKTLSPSSRFCFPLIFRRDVV